MRVKMSISIERPPIVGVVSANFCGYRVSRGQRGGRILGFLNRSRNFFFQVAPQLHKAEWTPFQTHYFTENLVAPGIESGPLDL
jgi:hypothetical protein